MHNRLPVRVLERCDGRTFEFTAPHPCKKRKDGATSVSVVPEKVGQPANSVSVDGNQGGLDQLEVLNAETQIDFVTIEVIPEPFAF
jgi:hypothetical protein